MTENLNSPALDKLNKEMMGELTQLTEGMVRKEKFESGMRSEKSKKWFSSMPDNIKKIARSTPPGLYMMKGHTFPYQLDGYNEDGTLHLTAIDPFFPRKVFGVKPEDLIELIG